MIRCIIIFGLCAPFFSMHSMHFAHRACKPVARNICYQRPLNTQPIKTLLADHKHNPDTLDDIRTHLHSLANGYENFLIATNPHDFRAITPERISTDIETSILHAHYRTKARGYFYAALGTVTSSMAIALALKAGDLHFAQETIANNCLLVGSIGSLTHTSHHALINAHDDLTNTNVNIETNIIFNTAILRDYLKKTEPEL